MSIHPQYVDRIMSGEKRYEFRKIKCAKKIDRMVIYATKPYGYIVGEADISQVIEGPKEEVWEKTKKFSGLSEKEYLDYFCNCKDAVAYRMNNVQLYSEHKNLKDINMTRPPQSYCYLDLNQYEKLIYKK